MANRKIPFDWIIAKDAVSGSNDLVSAKTDPGFVVCVQHVAFENETSATTDVRILKRRGGREFLYAEKDTLAADTLYVYDEQIYLVDGEQLVVRATGCTAGDDIKAYASGWRAASAIPAEE